MSSSPPVDPPLHHSHHRREILSFIVSVVAILLGSSFLVYDNYTISRMRAFRTLNGFGVVSGCIVSFIFIIYFAISKLYIAGTLNIMNFTMGLFLVVVYFKPDVFDTPSTFVPHEAIEEVSPTSQAPDLGPSS